MKRAFENRVALVTGAGSGIGQALTEHLARAGCVVVATDIHGERVEAVARKLQGEGWNTRSVPLNVVDSAALKCVIDDTLEEFGGIDYLFNNAGIGLTGPTERTTLEDWIAVLDVNVRGVVNGVAHAYPHMVQRGRGHIVNVASAAGLAPTPLMVAYATSKHAVVGLSTSLAAEARTRGVHVSVVCPGYIRTRIVDDSKYVNIDPQRAVQLMGKGISADQAAVRILRGVMRKRVIIPVTALAWVAWLFFRFFPRLHLPLAARMSKALEARSKTSD